jgi:hypothetical protein
MYINSNKPSDQFTSSPCKYPQKYFKDKPCRLCVKHFTPCAPSHMYCSNECAKIGHMNSYLKRTYKITSSDYFKMLRDQSELCKICRQEGFTMADHHVLKLVVDHCHKTGKVRGLLCHNCNRALGLFKDSVDTLKAAITYIEGATTIP